MGKNACLYNNSYVPRGSLIRAYIFEVDDILRISICV